MGGARPECWEEEAQASEVMENKDRPRRPSPSEAGYRGRPGMLSNKP